MSSGREPGIWEQGWDGHETHQRERLSRLPLSEKLRWLEEAHHLVLHLSTVAQASVAPVDDDMMKTVGRRVAAGGDAAVLQRTMAALRGTGAVVPRGVYRFESFEEADAWMIRTMARTHASLKSKTWPASAER